MKNIIIIAILFFCLETANSQVLKIHKNSGQDTTFKIDEIDSMTFNEPYMYGDSVLLFDDFESHPLYAFPYYTGWQIFNLTPDPKTLSSAVAMLDNKYHTSGQKAFKISTSSNEKILINNKLKRSPDIVYFEVRVYLEKLTNDSGKASTTEFGFRNIAESLSGENYAGIAIKEDGNFYCKIGPKETPISTVELNRWYRIRLMFDVPNKSLSVWFNLVDVVPKFSGFLPTFGYKEFSIISNNSDIYFDDLKIWESK